MPTPFGDMTRLVHAETMIGEPAAALQRPTPPAFSSWLERAVQALLRIRSTGEMEPAVLELVRRATGARWAALYREGDGGAWLDRACTLGVPQALCDGFPRELLDSMFGGQRVPLRCPEGAPFRELLLPDLEVIAPMELAGNRRAAFLLGPRPDGEPYRPEDLASLTRVAEWSGIALENALLLDDLRAQAYVDGLTGCFNRRAFDEHLRVECTRARRYDRPISLLLLDVDHFKWINDGHGHPAGDHALRRVGALLREAFRTTDRICRYGGDEFAVIFPETPRAEAARLAERMRERVAELFPDALLPRPLTASLGVATLPDDGGGPDELLRAADQALYLAKAAGRNRVAVA
jgi:diguanylate cyclase (GGDEF)-like protein